MTAVILTRHGHVDWIAPERFRGRAALPLTDTGQRQAEATAAFIRSAWPEAAVVYTSPMGRCVDTGAAIAAALGAACGSTNRRCRALCIRLKLTRRRSGKPDEAPAEWQARHWAELSSRAHCPFPISAGRLCWHGRGDVGEVSGGSVHGHSHLAEFD